MRKKFFLDTETFFLIISCTISLLIFINQEDSYYVRAIESRFADLVSIISYPQIFYSNLLFLKSENKDLSQKIAKMNLEISRLKLNKIENIRLRELLSFYNQSEFDLKVTQVINKNFNSSVKSIFIDLGLDENIVNKSVLIDMYGLVGKVISVGENASKVHLITDINFNVGIRIGNSMDLGLFVPSHGKYGTLEGVRKNAKISVEDIAYTSGLSNIFPKDIPVAKVIGIAKNNHSHFLDVEVELLFDSSNLNYLFILKPAMAANINHD